jgi:hypothetical protein
VGSGGHSRLAFIRRWRSTVRAHDILKLDNCSLREWIRR